MLSYQRDRLEIDVVRSKTYYLENIGSQPQVKHSFAPKWWIPRTEVYRGQRWLM